MTVLTVEDDPDQLTIRAMLLRASGFRVIEADSYPAAMNAAAAEGIECTVLDLRIPTVQDGIRLIRDLKKLKPAMLIYVLTGSPPHLWSRWPEVALADEVFTKGTALPSLLDRLKSIRDRVQDV